MPSFLRRLCGVPQAAPTQEASSLNRQAQSPVPPNTATQQDHQPPLRNSRTNERRSFMGRFFPQPKARASSRQVARPSYGEVPQEDMQRALRMSREEHDLQCAKNLSMDSFDQDSFDQENMRRAIALSMAEPQGKHQRPGQRMIVPDLENERMHLAMNMSLESYHAEQLRHAERARQEEGDLHFGIELSMASEKVADEMRRAVASGAARPEEAGELRRALEMSIPTPRASDGHQKQETQNLLDIFLASLQRIPTAKEQETVFAERPPEEADFSNQYARASSETKSAISRESVENKYGQILSNRGGGDCLFHALAGKNLSENEIIGLRARIADIKRNASDEERDKNMNANQLVAGLSQTPAIGPEKAMQLMFGRHAIPNDVYAKFQAIPGMYAGEDELKQWTLLEDNKDKTVVVIDSNQTPAAFKNGNRAPIAPNELDGQVEQANLLLYKSANHWEQIDGEQIVWKPIEK